MLKTAHLGCFSADRVSLMPAPRLADPQISLRISQPREPSPNFTLKDKQIIELANQGGRIRWKIENEGFNVQKNGGFDLEHAYTRDPIASKVFYFLLQIAHLIAQLIEKGSLFREAFPAGVGSAKNIAFRLLEAWRNLRVSTEQIHQMLNVRRQIRFAPP